MIVVLVAALLIVVGCGRAKDYVGTYAVPMRFSSPNGDVTAKSTITLNADGTWKLVDWSMEQQGLTEHDFSGTYTVSGANVTLNTDRGTYSDAKLKDSTLTLTGYPFSYAKE
jgi:uncharacterized lipoprotein NlpE involved in copper resistance